MNRHLYMIVSLACVCLLWGLSGIHPHDAANWFAESKIFFWTLPILAALAASVRLSKISITLICAFLVLHVIGMHYNYGEVPFGYWIGKLMHTDRNMYDRLTHFAFGFFMFYPVREVLLRIGRTQGFFNYFIPLTCMMSFSALYEIMEWYTVSGLSASVGYLFIGGNDPFDAEKDMLVATIGALLALAIIAGINACTVKDFWRNILESLKLRKKGPLSEDLLTSTLL